MKNRFFALVLLLFVMAALPLSVVRCDRSPAADASADSPVITAENSCNVQTTEQNTQQPFADETTISYAASLCRGDFCEEALRAAVIVANTNKKDLNSADYNSDFELKNRIASIYFSDKELTLQNSHRFVPVSLLSSGQTLTSDDYPYLSSVASPWDCLDQDFEEENACVGVSMCGVNYLCTRGYSAEEALLHYLPDFAVSS